MLKSFHLDIRIGDAAKVHCGQLHRLDDSHGEGLGVEVVLELVLKLAQILLDRALADKNGSIKIRNICSKTKPSAPLQSAPDPPPWRPILLAHRYLSVSQVLLVSLPEVAKHTNQ